MTAGEGNLTLISVYPNELKFIFELRKQIFCDLKVLNNTEHHVAFKVKTTTPKKYCVRPNIGVIQPSDSCVVRFTHQAQKEYPPDTQCTDKFMIQSTVVPSNTNMHDLASETIRMLFNKERNEEIEEYKFKVLYTFPSAQGNSGNEGLKISSTNSVVSLVVQSLKDEREAAVRQTLQLQEEMDLQQLKNERDAAVRQTLQLQEELGFQKRRKQRRNQCGCFFTFSVGECVD